MSSTQFTKFFRGKSVIVDDVCRYPESFTLLALSVWGSTLCELGRADPSFVTCLAAEYVAPPSRALSCESVAPLSEKFAWPAATDCRDPVRVRARAR